MKVLTFGDLHADRQKIAALGRRIEAERSDLLVSCGDLHHCGFAPWGLLEILSQVRIPLLYVSGNHDQGAPDDNKVLHWDRELEQATCLDEDVALIAGVRWFGIGGLDSGVIAGTRYIGGGREKRFYGHRGAEVLPRLALLAERLRMLDGQAKPGSQQVFVSHEPPQLYGTGGNPELDEFILKRGIITVICGHIHVDAPVVVKRDGVTIINPGPSGFMIEV